MPTTSQINELNERHFATFTKEEATKLGPLITAWGNGAAIEYACDLGNKEVQDSLLEWQESKWPDWDNPAYHFRMKQ